MSTAFILRAGVTLFVILAGFVAFRMVNSMTLARASNQKNYRFTADGKPVLLFFSSPTCVPCKQIQLPAVNKIRDRFGDRIMVVEIDATAQPQIASAWGVLSVPTTFIIDGHGKPRLVNHGVTSTEKLRQQLESIL